MNEKIIDSKGLMARFRMAIVGNSEVGIPQNCPNPERISLVAASPTENDSVIYLADCQVKKSYPFQELPLVCRKCFFEGNSEKSASFIQEGDKPVTFLSKSTSST